MIFWEKIVESHVIRVFRKISYKWWGVDIQFYDASGVKRSAICFSQNSLCNLVHSVPKGVKLCAQTYQKNLKNFKKNQKPFFYQCFAGLQGLATPIFVKQKYVGAMIASGIRIFEDNDPIHKRYKETLLELGFDKIALNPCYENMETIDHNKKAYLLDFMEIVADDVVAFYTALQEKDEITEKQPLLLENIYREKYKEIIGTSTAMKGVFDTLELIERSESPVLIEGESGTGKELIAAALHYNSPRKDKTFVIQNCSAFSDTLLNSELFGHEKGSFTGAVSEKKGLFEIADKGTLFLDEVGDMNIEIQAKLLRVLEDGSFYRVGGIEPKKTNVRVVAATNRGLKNLVEQGLFRKDLFYRINTIHITLPSLRERKEDILLLIDYFLDYYATLCTGGKKEINPAARELLQSYHWPGNIRELKNMMERLVLLSGASKIIEVQHIPRDILAEIHSGSQAHEESRPARLNDALKTLEKNIVCDALKRAKWNKSSASRELGISRASLNNKITEFNIHH